MKSFLKIVAISLFLLVDGYASNIVFVHMGKNVPACLFTTLKQSRFMNQDSDIYLLMDEPGRTVITPSQQEILSKNQVMLVDTESIPLSLQHKQFRENNKIDDTILEGFWLFALERFFYLFDFVKERNLENIIHLESDTMLYIDIEELMPFFTSHEIKIAAPFQSTVGCIPCFVFIHNIEAFEPLVDHIIKATKEYKGNLPHIEINDMQTLASFFARFGDNFITTLPILMGEYGDHFSKRESNFAPDNQTPLEFLSRNETLFPGYIFDAAALGVFANGNDRRYIPHTKPGVIHYRSIFDPGNFFFFWGRDQKKRKVPYLRFQEKTYRIVNLHFHSKFPEGHTSYAKRQTPFPKKSHSY